MTVSTVKTSKRETLNFYNQQRKLATHSFSLYRASPLILHWTSKTAQMNYPQWVPHNCKGNRKTSWGAGVQCVILLLICRLLVPLTIFISQNIHIGYKFITHGRSITFWWKSKDRWNSFWNLKQQKMALYRWWNCTLSVFFWILFLLAPFLSTAAAWPKKKKM